MTAEHSTFPVAIIIAARDEDADIGRRTDQYQSGDPRMIGRGRPRKSRGFSFLG